MSKKEHLAAYVDREVYKKLEEIAKEQKRSVSFIVVELIEKFLKEKENER